jgi:hypothetical protein
MTRIALLLGAIPLLSINQTLMAYATWPKAWLATDVPVFYEINQNGTPDCEGEFGAIHQAFETWENISTSWIEFNDGPNTSRMPTLEDGHNTIGWIESGWTSLPLDPPPDPQDVSIVAVQDPNLDWIIDECDQYFNGEYWSWSTTGQSSRFDVENVAAHEAGHWLGDFRYCQDLNLDYTQTYKANLKPTRRT